MSKTNQKPAVLKTCTAAARAAEAHAHTALEWAERAEVAELNAQNAAEASHRSARTSRACFTTMEAAHASMDRRIAVAIILSGLSFGFTLAAMVL